MSNFEQQFLQHLTAIQAALGGGNVALTEPRSFQSDALLMLAAIALAADGAGTTAEWSGISGDLVDQDELNTALASKQDTPVDYLTDIINRPDLSVFDNVDTHPNLAAFPATGDAEKIYIAADTNTPYRWTGAAYASIATVNDTLAAIGLLNSGQGFLYRALPLGTWELAAIALNTLTDTDVGAPQAGEILEYDGSNWVNAVPSSGGPVEQTTPLSSPSNGDRWLQVDASGYPVEEWFWHSTAGKWLSTTIYTVSPDVYATGGSLSVYTDMNMGLMPWPGPIYVLSADIVTVTSNVANESLNHWDVYLRAQIVADNSNSVTFITASDTLQIPTVNRLVQSLQVRSEMAPTPRPVMMFQLVCAPTGSPNDLSVESFCVKYRRVYS